MLRALTNRELLKVRHMQYGSLKTRVLPVTAGRDTPPSRGHCTLFETEPHEGKSECFEECQTSTPRAAPPSIK